MPRSREREVLIVHINISETYDMFSGIEADYGIPAHSGHADTLKVAEALGPDRFMGEEEASNGFADLRLVRATVIVSRQQVVERGAHNWPEADVRAPWKKWWMR